MNEKPPEMEYICGYNREIYFLFASIANKKNDRLLDGRAAGANHGAPPAAMRHWPGTGPGGK
ncbi:MAG TPA: hypothetical protein PL181_13600 [bacterium]|nr:hypothetical protein [bacterium]